MDTVDSPHAGNVDLLEHHPAAAQLVDHGLDVLDLPRHLGMLTRRRAGRLEQREPPAAAQIEQTARPLLDRLETELLRVERPCPGKVLSRKPGSDVTVLKHVTTLPQHPTPQA
jgi:hypothetical protein